MPTNPPWRAMRFDAAEHPHHVMIMLRRRIADAEDPVEQIGIGTFEQRLEAPKLIVIQRFEGVLGERAENEIAFLRPAMPTPKQEAPAAKIPIFAIGLGRHFSHPT